MGQTDTSKMTKVAGEVADIRANLNPDASVDRCQVTLEVAFRVEEVS